MTWSLTLMTRSAAALLVATLAASCALTSNALAWQNTEAQDDLRQQAQTLDLRTTEFIFVEGSLPLVPRSNTIVSKLPLSLRLTPNNVGVVTRALFEQQYGQVLGDALRNVSSINVQPGFGVHDYFVIRGFDSLSSSLILTDGAPEPEATFYQLYNIELVEVLKGPGGFLYGSNPLAGTVNLVRKQPFPLSSLDIGAAFGSFSTVEGTVDANFGSPQSDLAFRVNALVRDARGYRNQKANTVVAVNPALSWRLSDHHSVNTSFEYVRSEFAPDAGVPLLLNAVPDVDRKNNYNSPLDRSEQDVYRFQVDYQGRLSETLTLRSKLYYRRLRWLSSGTLINGVVQASVFRTAIALDDDQTFFGNQLEAILSFETGHSQHSLLAGVELSRLADEFSLGIGLLAPVDLVDPVDPGLPPFPLPGQGAAGDTRSRIFAPYVIDQISFSERFQLSVGARLDVIDFDDPLTGRQRDDHEISPMLGAVYLPHPNLSLYGNYSRSFAPPSPRVFSQLEPEESEQVEFGVRLELLDRRGRITAAVYELERQNIAIPDDNGFTQQVGNQRSRGFEFELAAEPGGGLRAVLSYAYNDAELTQFAEQLLVPGPTGLVPVVIDHSGNRPAFAPQHLFDFWGSKSFRSGLGIGLGARYVGAQFIAEDNRFTIPDAFIVSAALSYGWAGYRVSLNVKNLTDTEYLWRGFGSQSVTPANPIAATLRLGYDF